MNFDTYKNLADNYIEIAKIMLSNARATRQEYECRKLHSDIQPNNIVCAHKAMISYQMSSLFRQQARLCLMAYEVIVGQAYMEGHDIKPLRTRLDGKCFKEWECYKAIISTANDGTGDIWL